MYKALINSVDSFLLKGEVVLKQYSRPTLNETISYFLFRYFNFKKANNNFSAPITFLITSNAEVRVFKPIIKLLLNNDLYNANIIYLSFAEFDDDFQNEIVNSTNVKLTKSVYPIIESSKSKKSIFVICIDFLFYPEFHKIGIQIINYLNEKGSKTVCVQHGGTQKDNIIGQSTSSSKFQIVYGKYVYNELVKLNIDTNKLYLTGNPWHDDILEIKKEDVLKTLDFDKSLSNRKIILLATCLHTEYIDKENEIELYRNYVNKIYNSIDFEEYVLIVKMHPSDSVKPNLYLEELNKYVKHLNSVKIIKHGEGSLNFYQCSIISDLIISRSSTVMEEALMLNKKVISFDLFQDGPSKFYKHLESIDTYRRVIGYDADLNNEIKTLMNQKLDTKNLKNDLTSLITYKLDGKSKKRILDAFVSILKL